MKREPPTHISLHQRIYDELNKHSVTQAANWDAMSPIAQVSDDRQAMSIANQFWRIQLGGLQINTSQPRECLVDTISFDAWWYDFVNYVIPTIASAGLPRQ